MVVNGATYSTLLCAVEKRGLRGLFVCLLQLELVVINSGVGIALRGFLLYGLGRGILSVRLVAGEALSSLNFRLHW